MLIVGYGEDGSMLWVANLLMLFSFNTQPDTIETEYDFISYMKCMLAVNGVKQEPGCMFLR